MLVFVHSVEGKCKLIPHLPSSFASNEGRVHGLRRFTKDRTAVASRAFFGGCRSGLASLPIPRTGKDLHSQVSWLSKAIPDFAGTRLSWLRSVSCQWRLSDPIREWPRGTKVEPPWRPLPCLIISQSRHHLGGVSAKHNRAHIHFSSISLLAKVLEKNLLARSPIYLAEICTYPSCSSRLRKCSD